MVEYEVGDAAKALSGAAKLVEATYWSEYCYHAQMEPMNCVAKVSEDGQSAEIWTGTQFGWRRPRQRRMVVEAPWSRH